MDEFRGRVIAGIDEAGRGPIAGPVVAAAVLLPTDFFDHRIMDSKRMKMTQLLEAEELIREVALGVSVVTVGERVIERQNILQATFLAMNRAVEGLKIQPDLLLVDGNRFRTTNSIEYRTIVGGDAKYQCISAASIVAKTFRDRIMITLHEKHPEYGWNKNMGYPTPEHLDAVKKYGVTEYHRRTFRGVREYIKELF